MSKSSITETKQYLTFQLGEETFGIDVSKAREILEFTTVTKIPNTPEYMRGVINLRGSVVPVFDLRLKFGMPETEKTIHTCIVVVEAKLEDENTVIGALVDSVQEVFELEPDNIEQAPKIGMHLNSDFIKGMGKRDDRFVIILDTDSIFTMDELYFAQGPQDSVSERKIANE
ncbi:MAG: chemotaxis protein CheW [Syntrophorhabdus sp.]